MSGAREMARLCISRGWEITTLEPKGKRCIDPDWLTRTYTADDFKDDHNLGIKSTRGLVDMDCDCAEAVAMAEVFAPKTQAKYGRRGRPRSHWLFRCPEITTPVAYKDLIAKRTLIEIRVNHQSMAPPSIHPEGEAVEWDDPAFITSGIAELTVEKALLARSVQLIATGSMMARYYNPPGARHDWGVALAGLLRRLTVKEHEAALLFKTAGTWVKDDKVKDRLDAVRTTYSLDEDTPATAGTKLAELIGENGKDFVATLHKIWGNDIDGVGKTKLEAMNKRHAVLFRQGGKVTILTEAFEDGKLQIRYTNRHDFNMLYPRRVQVGVTPKGQPIMKTLAEAWIEHPKRRAYDGIELAPNGRCNPNYYNLWQGFSVEPKKGDWSLYRQHLSLLVRGVPEHLDYLIAWFAETVRHPERPIGIAPTFKGKQGTGKSTAAKWFGSLFGAHFMHLDSEHRLLGHFNAHLHNAIVVLADEAVWAGGKQGLGALKRMITEDTLAIEPKGLDVINVRNMLHMLVASNEEWVVPTNFDNRRFAIFEVSDEHRNDHKFFGAVAEQLFERGGLAALLYDLLEHRGNINLREIPDTDELHNQKVLSIDDAPAWLLERLQQGTLCDLPWPLGKAEMFRRDTVHTDYIQFLERHRKWTRNHKSTESQLGKFLRKYTPFRARETRQGGTAERLWEVPPLDTCRAFFEKAAETKVRWEIVEREPGEDDVDVPF